MVYSILIVIPRFFPTRFGHITKADYKYIFPLGLGYISAVLKEAGHDVQCLNLNHFDGTVKELVEKSLKAKKYDYVATGNNAVGYDVAEIILDVANNHPSHPKTILGGPIITTEPELIFESLKPDYGVLGEGERTVVELLDVLEKGKKLKDVKGIIYRDDAGSTIKTGKRESIDDLDSIPYPDLEGFGFREQLDNMHANDSFYSCIFDKPRIYSLLASRSCPYQCTFCYHDSKYRKRSLKSIMDEFRTVVKTYEINIVFLIDDCFAVDEKSIYAFCDEVKKLRSEISWDLRWICQLRVETVNPELLRAMKEAGCFMIGYGFESYSQVVLKSMKKYIKPEQIDKALKMTMDEQIAVQGNFIFGDVAETKETGKETLDYWEKNGNGQIFLDFIQPYPGSEIYKHCVNKGLIKDKLEFIKSRFEINEGLNMTDKMTDEEFRAFRKEVHDAAGKYVKYALPSSIKKRRDKTYSLKVKCPYCKEDIVYNNFVIEDRWKYEYRSICKNCYKRFTIVGVVKKIVYSQYSKIEPTIKRYRKIKRIVQRKTI